MKTILYLTDESALALHKKKSQWHCELVSKTGVVEVDKIHAWFRQQSNSSVAVVLDVPDIGSDICQLRSKSQIKRRWEASNIVKHFCETQAITSNTVLSLNDKSRVLRLHSVKQSKHVQEWSLVLERHRRKLEGLYSACLLLEYWVSRLNASSTLLCFNLGDNHVRHAYFYHGKLCFLRTLNKNTDVLKGRGELADSILYLHEHVSQYISSAIELADIQVFADKEMCISGTILAAHESIEVKDLLSRASFGVKQVCNGDTKKHPIPNYLASLLDCLVKHPPSSKNLRTYRLRWLSPNSVQLKPSFDASHRWTRNSIGLLFVLVVCVFYMDVRIKSENQILSKNLLSIQSRHSHLQIKPELMHDAVYLHKKLRMPTHRHIKTLSALASVMADSPAISLFELNWTVLDVESDLYEEFDQGFRPLAIQQNASVNITNIGNPVGMSLYLRGSVTGQQSSIASQYKSYDAFLTKLIAHADVQVIAQHQIPFDTAVTNRIDARVDSPGSNEFVLLLQANYDKS